MPYKWEERVLRFFDSPLEAAATYKEAKEGEAKRLAVEYKDSLTEDQYKKLHKFKLSDIHRKS